MIIVLVILILLFVLYVLSTMCRFGADRMEPFRKWNFAHRGLHGNEVPENSIKAFHRARDKGYGIELDVHLLSDGNLAVIHDSTLMRTAGSEGRIEDLTISDLDNYYLENTMQTIPAFSKVLDLVNGQVPLIIELKTAGNNYAQICQRACEMLDKYQGTYCLESFDPRCIYWLRKNRPDLIRGQLAENYFKSNTSKLHWLLKFAGTNQMLNFLTRPDFVAYKFADRKCLSDWLVRKLWKSGCVTWTVVNKRELDTAKAENRIPIFEGFLPE